MEYKIGRKGKEQTFKLDFVSNYCHLKYGELVDLSFTLSDTVAQFQKDILAEGGKPFARSEFVKKNRELETQIKTLREDILRELSETNDYTYDAGWWMHNATPAEVNAIVTDTVRGEIENTKAIKKKVKFYRERLLAALNKHWRPLTEREYLHQMDIGATNNAIAVACFPEPIINWIWEPQIEEGFHFRTEVVTR